MINFCSDSEGKDVQALVKDQRYKLARLVCWTGCIAFALLEAWSGRQFTFNDGIAYLDMSDALLKHNLHMLINPHWSPLYPFLIGVATWIARPSAHWELPIAHAVNFAIFLGTLAAFEFLLRQVICVLAQGNGRQNPDLALPQPTWRWQLLGYFLFAWGTIVLIGLRNVTPEPRYVAPFVVLVLLGLLPGILLQKSKDATRRSAIATLVLAASVTFLTLMALVHRAASTPIFWTQGGYGQTAESLNREGLRPGVDVAIIGDGDEQMTWARLARLRIVAQIPPEDADDFWRISDPREKAEVYDAFAKAGAMAVVTDKAPPPDGFADWQRVGDTKYYVHFLA